VRVLAEPPRTGLNWLVYILPPVIILAGAILLLRAMKIWTKPASAFTKTISKSSDDELLKKDAPKDDYVMRLEEELRKRK
jgi:cytochrome c-type biogenesis protein CcmH